MTIWHFLIILLIVGLILFLKVLKDIFNRD